MTPNNRLTFTIVGVVGLLVFTIVAGIAGLFVLNLRPLPAPTSTGAVNGAPTATATATSPTVTRTPSASATARQATGTRIPSSTAIVPATDASAAAATATRT